MLQSFVSFCTDMGSECHLTEYMASDSKTSLPQWFTSAPLVADDVNVAEDDLLHDEYGLHVQEH
eukprot:1597066-Amphidinium_carterae.1